MPPLRRREGPNPPGGGQTVVLDTPVSDGYGAESWLTPRAARTLFGEPSARRAFACVIDGGPWHCAANHSTRALTGGRKPPLVKAGSTSVKTGMSFVGSPSQGRASSCPTLRRPPKERRASKSEMLSAR